MHELLSQASEVRCHEGKAFEQLSDPVVCGAAGTAHRVVAAACRAPRSGAAKTALHAAVTTPRRAAATTALRAAVTTALRVAAMLTPAPRRRAAVPRRATARAAGLALTRTLLMRCAAVYHAVFGCWKRSCE